MFGAKTTASGIPVPSSVGDMTLRLGPDLAHDPVPLAVGEPRRIFPAFDLPFEAGVRPQMMAVRSHVQPVRIGAEAPREKRLETQSGRSQRPKLGKGALLQRRPKVGRACRAAGPGLVADDPLDRQHMLVPPARKRVVDVDELLGKLVEIEPAIGVAIDFEPGGRHRLLGPIAEVEAGPLQRSLARLAEAWLRPAPPSAGRPLPERPL